MVEEVYAAVSTVSNDLVVGGMIDPIWHWDLGQPHYEGFLAYFDESACSVLWSLSFQGASRGVLDLTFMTDQVGIAAVAQDYLNPNKMFLINLRNPRQYD